MCRSSPGGWLALATTVALLLPASAAGQIQVSSAEARELGSVRLSSRDLMPSVVGIVELSVVILSDGTVGDTRVTKSLDVDLDHQALVAARYWLFEPARLNGRPVAAIATLVLEFRLH